MNSWRCLVSIDIVTGVIAGRGHVKPIGYDNQPGPQRIMKHIHQHGHPGHQPLGVCLCFIFQGSFGCIGGGQVTLQVLADTCHACLAPVACIRPKCLGYRPERARFLTPPSHCPLHKIRALSCTTGFTQLGMLSIASQPPWHAGGQTCPAGTPPLPAWGRRRS